MSGHSLGKHYTRAFYAQQALGSEESAAVIVPLVLNLLPIKSVIDVGCGLGTWLSVFARHGVSDVCGVDGDWIDRSVLRVPVDRFLAVDLTRPIDVGRRFDLVISLEVAEHLPEAVAATFVESLVKLGPVVVFSAAIPFQGGTNHLNEQWPDYWKQLFEAQDYVPIDCIRPRVWLDERVEYTYAQNSILYAHRDSLETNPQLAEELRKTSTERLSIVHPNKYLEARMLLEDAQRRADPRNQAFRSLAAALPIAGARALARRISKLRRTISGPDKS